MGSRTKKGPKDKSIHSKSEIFRSLTEYSTAAIFMIMCILLPLYMKDGYKAIGEAKSDSYKAYMIPALVILLVAGAVHLAVFLAEERKQGSLLKSVRDSVSKADLFVLAYLILSVVAMICGGFYKTAIWGYSGWNMGLMAQISFVLIYFFVSRYGTYYQSILKAMCIVALITFVLAILNRLNIDPIGYYEGLTDYQKAMFLSTLGQVSWYGSFMVVILPVLVGFYLYAKESAHRILGLIGMSIGFATLVSYNGDSAYFALAACMLVFLWDSVNDWEKLFRYLTIPTLFLAIGKGMNLLLTWRKNPELIYDSLTGFILESAVTWVLLAICLILCLIIYLLYGKMQKHYSKQAAVKIRNVIYLVLAAVTVLVGILWIGQVAGIFGEVVSEKLEKISYFRWDNEWGNGRGRIWSFGWKVFTEESFIHKIFGIGPECFYEYTMVHHTQEIEQFWGGMALVNVHNEWLNTLISHGVIGCLSYIGIFVALFVKCFRCREKNFMFVTIPAVIVSYAAYNIFCYQEVLCTPFVFLLMGIGEYLYRVSSSV